MKLNLKSLLKDKNVLYIVLFIAVANLFGFLMLRQFDAIILFLLVGFLSTYFSKNMIIILLVAILSTNFLIGTKLIGKKIKEGMATGVDKKEVKTSSTKLVKEDESSTTGGKKVKPSTAAAVGKPKGPKTAGFTTLSPANFNEGDESISTSNGKVDYAATLESAYDNLDKMLGSDAIRSMTEDTQRLAEKQKMLMGNIKQLEPMMQKAGSLLEGLDMGKMTKMMNGLSDKLDKTTNKK